VAPYRRDPRGFGLARFLQDGTADGNFGRGGKVLTDFHAGATANALVVQAAGKIVAAGSVGGKDFAVARYTRSGRLDGSFGQSGKVITDFSSLWQTHH
jgi:uncharacterized delta-60 repeat protein